MCSVYESVCGSMSVGVWECVCGHVCVCVFECGSVYEYVSMRVRSEHESTYVSVECVY